MAKQPLIFAVPKNFDPTGEGNRMPDRFNFSFDPVTLEFCLIDNAKNPALPASEVACWSSNAGQSENKLNRVEYNTNVPSLEDISTALTPLTFLGEANQRYEGTPNAVLILVRTNDDATALFELKSATGAIIASINVPNAAGYVMYSAFFDEFTLPTTFTKFTPFFTVGSESGNGTLDVVQIVLLNLPIP